MMMETLLLAQEQAMPPSTMAGVVTAVFIGVALLVTTIVNAWVTIDTRRELRKRDAARAAEVKDVKDTLQVNTSDTKRELREIHKVGVENAQVGRATHILVNNNMAIQLRENVDLAEHNLMLARRIVPADAELVRKAEGRAANAKQLLSDHMAKQGEVDARGGGA